MDEDGSRCPTRAARECLGPDKTLTRDESCRPTNTAAAAATCSRPVSAVSATPTGGPCSARGPPGQLLIYQDESLNLQVWLDGQTVWLPRRLIAELFQVSVKTANEHLVNIYSEGELGREATIRSFRIVQREGSRLPSPNPLSKKPPARPRAARLPVNEFRRLYRIRRRGSRPGLQDHEHAPIGPRKTRSRYRIFMVSSLR